MLAFARNSVIYLLLALVISNGKVAELVKIPILAEHYFEHKNEKSDLSFVDFLVMHYWGDDNNQNDNNVDHQLPFKSNDILLGVEFMGEIPPLIQLDQKKREHISLNEKNYPIKNLFYAFDFHSKMIDPPDFVS